MLNKILLGILFVVLSTSSLPAAVAEQAQDTTAGLSVFPAIIEMSGDPGQSNKVNLNITNTTQTPLPVDLDVRSLVPVDSIIDLSRRVDFDASKWIKLDTSQFALEPNATKTITVTIEIPDTALPGGHYAELYIKSLQIQTSVNNQPAQTRLIPEIKVPVLVRVSGDAKEELSIKQENAFPATIQNRMPLTTTVSIANTGTVHLLPTIAVQLWKGDILAQETLINPFIVLPNTVKTVELPWTPDVSSGLYKATVELRYGTNQQADSLSKESILVFPPWYVVFGIPASLVVIIYLVIKRRNITAAIRVLIGKNKQV